MRQILLAVMIIFMAHIWSSSLLAQETGEWQELNSRTIGFYKEQKFIKASGAGRQAVAAARQLPEADRDKLASSLGNLAMIYTHLGKFAEAEELAKEELALRQQIFGKENLEVITAWNHLAIVYTMASKMAPINPDAEHCLLQIVAIEEKVNGKESQAVIPALIKLEKYYRITGNSEKEKETADRIAALKTPGI
jgi:tetratricopeptide (TPR) repeat protein